MCLTDRLVQWAEPTLYGWLPCGETNIGVDRFMHYDVLVLTAGWTEWKVTRGTVEIFCREDVSICT